MPRPTTTTHSGFKTEESKPRKYAAVEKWFDKRLNVLMNQQLLSSAR